MQLNFEFLKKVVLKHGFKFFDGDDYNLNLIGIRNTRDLQANTFNDVFCVAYRVQGEPKLLQFACTTDPGVYFREHPINVNGTAILPRGQHLGIWQIGAHRGVYEALVQRKQVTVIRDRNANATLDFNGNTETGLFGINCHRASAQSTSTQVDKWSAGCQVIADRNDFNMLMATARISANMYSNSFSYTLLEDRDFE